jgi:ABC-type polysaccharide/polyol phosphate transport system ATPase subunit
VAIVSLDNISFSYPVFEVTGRSLKVTLMRQVTGAKLRGEKGTVTVQALDSVSLEAREGDRVGLIGRNGSGKSTTLRVIAGLAHPQTGRVRVQGRLVPLIEKGLGIHGELTGYQNIELPLRLLGASTKEVKQASLDIPEFTGLGEFMNLPVRTYSEGMRTRLAFAICTSINADILVLDEWLAAGDIDFHERAEGRLRSMLDRTAIVILASHSLELIGRVCNKVAWMEAGNLIMYGPTHQVLASYLQSVTSPVRLADTA